MAPATSSAREEHSGPAWAPPEALRLGGLHKGQGGECAPGLNYGTYEVTHVQD